MTAHRLTRLDRWWIRRHQRHGHVLVNTNITVPAFDRTSRGVLMVCCECGKDRAR